MIEYKPYEERYFNQIKEITLEAFQLTSFDTDRNLPKRSGGRIAWEIWCKPVLTSDKHKYCIMSLSGSEVAGYIIYGGDAGFSKVTGKKIGSIILLAVRKEFRGKNHIAENLVQTVLTLFLQYQFNMVMVGTDADNLPAVFIYLKTGFKPYFQWGTFRYHYQGPFLKSSLKIEKVGPDDKKTMRKFISLIDRPFSLVHDRTLKPHVNGLLKYMSEKAQEEIQQGKSELVCVKEKNKVLAYYTFAEQKGISRVLGKKFFRINDLVFLNKNHDKSIKSMHAFLKYLSMKEASILEVFIRINDWPGIKVLCQSGFTLVHMTTTLHKHLK